MRLFGWKLGEKKFGPSARKLRGSQKFPKRSFFGLQNVKNFELDSQKFFSNIFFQPRRAKRQFTLKKHFFKESKQKDTICKKSHKISKSAKLFFGQTKNFPQFFPLFQFLRAACGPLFLSLLESGRETVQPGITKISWYCSRGSVSYSGKNTLNF